MANNWGKELVKLADSQVHNDDMYRFIQAEMKQVIANGGNASDADCGELFKYFAITTLYCQFQKGLIEAPVIDWLLSPEEFIKLDELKEIKQ